MSVLVYQRGGGRVGYRMGFEAPSESGSGAVQVLESELEFGVCVGKKEIHMLLNDLLGILCLEALLELVAALCSHN